MAEVAVNGCRPSRTGASCSMSRPDSRPEPPRRRGLCAFVGILLAVLGIPGLLGDGPGVRATALPAQQGARSGFTLMDPATTGG